MASRPSFMATYWMRVICLSILLLNMAIGAGTVSANSTSTLPTANTEPNHIPVVTAKSAPHSSPSATKPLWQELTPAQQQALAPFVTEWDQMESMRKKKWLEIGNKFSTMKPEEQQRVQARMREWAKLTPDQRRLARESYVRTKKLNRDQKSAHWQQYQQLPEEQKKKLAADAMNKKRVANLPSTHSKNKTIAPIKSTPKPILEQSVTPQVTNQPSAQTPAAPAK